MSEPSQLVLAYCAGVIDSDGMIGIARVENKWKKSAVYIAHVRVRQIDPQAIRVFVDTFTGFLYLEKIYNRRQRERMIEWAARNKQAEIALRALLPFLRIKRAQAENALELRDVINANKQRGGPCGRSPEYREALETIWLRGKHLNTARVVAP